MDSGSILPSFPRKRDGRRVIGLPFQEVPEKESEEFLPSPSETL